MRHIRQIPARFCMLFVLLLCLPVSAQTKMAMLERLEANLSGPVPQWLGGMSKSSYARLIHARYSQAEKLDELDALLLPQASKHYSSLLNHYLAYRLLAESGYWCASPQNASDYNLAAYLLWLQGDLVQSNLRLGEAAQASCLYRLEKAATQPAAQLASDASFQAALRHYQQRHKLPGSGELDAATLALLQQSPADIAGRLAHTLQRMRQIDAELQGRYLVANIPGFESWVYEHGQQVLRLKSIVGKTSRPTPQFSSQLSSIVFNPRWNVPPKLVYRDLIPKQLKDPNYLSERSFRILPEWGSEESIDPASLDWQALRHDFPYQISQMPGPRNALGQLKFVTPNERAIYLHDTNARYLFDKDRRAFSSGCVRLQNPQLLAEYLLNYEQSPHNSQSLLESEKMRYIALTKPLDVHYVYWTSWVDHNGVLQIRDDIYQQDIAREQPLQMADKGSEPSELARL